MNYRARIGKKIFELEIQGQDQEIILKLDGKPLPFDFQPVVKGRLYSLIVDHRCYQVSIKPDSTGYLVEVGNRKYRVELEDERTQRLKSLIKTNHTATALAMVKAPMPGLVAKLEVDVGQPVTKGQGLIIVEAMKMENELRAPVDGVVKEVRVKEKETIDKDSVLIVIGPIN